MPAIAPIAVLTGDLIGSTRLSRSELLDAHSTLSKAVEQMGESWPSFGPVTFSTFRGDSWQLVTRDTTSALRAALYIRARLKSLADIVTDTRVAIGIATTPLYSTEEQTVSTGEAFILSGHALDAMKKETLSIAIPDGQSQGARWLEAMVYACGELTSGWTKRQADINAVALLQKSLTQAELANALSPPVKQQTIADSFAGSRWHIVDSALAAFEETDWNALFDHAH